jgi:aspartate aminotransferase
MQPRISERARRLPASPIRKLMPIADEAKRRGIHVYHLNIGQPDLETPAVMRERLARCGKVFAYTPSAGTPEYLDSLCAYYGRLGIALELSQLIATTGGSEAILFALFAAAAEGDEALVVEPYYTNYNSFAAMAGVRLVPLRTRGEDGFRLPAREAWERALTAHTRAVLLCNPNNPTGTVYTREELETVAAFCRDHGLFLIADEVYRELVYDGRRAVSALNLAGFEDLVIVVDSLSKRYSACGIRLGCLATRSGEVYQAALRMAQGRLSPPGLGQLVASGAVELGADYFAAIAAEYEARRNVLYDGLSEIPGLFLNKPEGAFYFIARLPILDSEDFARFLLADFSYRGATVMVAPAPGFYATPGLGQDEVRIAYVLRKSDLEQAIGVLAAGLAAYRKARGIDELPRALATAAHAFHGPVV